MRVFRSLCIFSIIICAGVLLPAEARPMQEASDGSPDPLLVEQCINELGVGARVEVRLAGGQVVTERIDRIYLTMFRLRPDGASPPTYVEFTQVMGLRSATPLTPPSAYPSCHRLETITQRLESDWQNVVQIPADTEILVEGEDSDWHRGNLVAADDAGIVLQRGARSHEIARQSVHRVWRLGKPQTKKVALLGAAAGCGVGALLAPRFRQICSNANGDCEGGDLFRATLSFCGVGAGAGALLGSRAKNKTLVYRRVDWPSDGSGESAPAH